MMLVDEEYRARHAEMERVIRTSSQGEEAQRMTVFTIPVVVHIFHSGEPVGTGVNISDEQVMSAIAGLNEDYRRMPGTNGFGSGVDVEMEFCLASRDPQGNPTNGIVRVDASGIPLYSTEGISVGQGSGCDETDLKDLSRWDRDDYYNIWIVNEIDDNNGGSGIQGFAYFPSSSVSRDGAVILYNAFGTVGNLKSYTNRNRTVTHEVGHGFSLYHTFQGNSCSESNCDSQGDRVCDTPPTVTNTSCNSPACSGTQLVENYMDYTNEDCMDMFTQGQKTRMRDALMTQRSSLMNSMGCTPPNAWDAGITAIHSPNDFSCISSISPVVEVKNFGSNTINSVAIKYRVDNGPLQTYTYSSTLPSTESATVSLPALSAGPGEHTLEVFTQSPNGNTDGFQSNDASTGSFSVVEGNTVTVAIQVDNYGNETTWEVLNSSNQVVANGGPYPTDMYGTVFEENFCLPAGCYDFVIYDSYGDGLCCGGGFGGYEVTDQQGNTLAEFVTDFSTIETTPFCITAAAGGSPPSANFSVNNTQACAGSSFQFSDQSSGNPTSRTWTFQGGSPATSTAANPTVTFNSPGPHDVTLTVSNANGIDTEQRLDYITVTSAPNLNTAVSQPNCWNSNDGSVNLSVNGGTAPFSYSWSNGSSSQDISDLSGGSYSVTVSDASSCTATTSVTVVSPANLNVNNTSSTPATCNPDGTASISPSGGTPPYTYLWSNNQTSSTVSGLSGGTYTVVVTDSNGCQKTKTITVESTGGVATSAGAVSNVTCNGGSDGSATVSASGGQGPYTYSWNGMGGQTTATATGLSAGNYSVNVTDANGCGASQSFTITQPTALITSLAPTEALCFGMANGALQGSMSGGTPPYSYHWNGAGFGQTLNPQNVAAGTYNFTVNDANGCQTVTSATVSQPDEMVATVVSMTPDSCQMDVGSAEIEVTGGVGMYSVIWDDTDEQEGFILMDVRHGDYAATITDQNSCVKMKNVNIEEVDCGIVNGLEELSPAWSANIFPNPLHGTELSIQLSGDVHGAIRATLMDITGQIVQDSWLTNGQSNHSFHIGTEVAEGIYLLQLSEGPQVYTQRVMVIR
jgi:PKD repeat protein